MISTMNIEGDFKGMAVVPVKWSGWVREEFEVDLAENHCCTVMKLDSV